MIVVIYGGQGKFGGKPQFEWESPNAGSTHNFMLFAAQNDGDSNTAFAHAELARMGFVDVELRDGKPIDVEVLNEPSMATFRRHYEGALDEGFSLVWYP
jgi:hypothetical protein